MDEWTNGRMDEWKYILILGGWAGFVDSLIRRFADSLIRRFADSLIRPATVCLLRCIRDDI